MADRRGGQAVWAGVRPFPDRLLVLLILGLVRISGRLPISWSLALGAGVGRVWCGLRGPRSRRVRDQIARALPEFDRHQHILWSREVFLHLGRSLAEVVLLMGRRRAALIDRVSVEGLTHLEAAEAQSRGGGVLIVTAHYGNWELACARMAMLGIRPSVVYRPLARPAFDALLYRLREGGKVPDETDGTEVSIEQIPMGRGGMRAARALAEGRKLVVLLDQNARSEEGLFVDFFGLPACTRFGPLALAAARGCPVVPAFIRRDPDGRSHTLRVHPALQLEPGGSDNEGVLQRNLQRVTAVIENEIREAPGQWIWTHRRWRTRPASPDSS